MKKLYILILLCSLAKFGNAQITLTKAANEPVVGDFERTVKYDSTSAMNHSSGTNQTWNYSTITTTASMATSTYTTPSTCTGYGSQYSSATVGKTDGTASEFYKATATQYELVGMVPTSTLSITFTNSAIAAIWPITSSYNNVDAFAGSISTTFSSIPVTLPISGNQTVTSTGTGTVNLPNSITLPNCMQVTNKLYGSGSTTIFTLTISYTITSLTYNYFNATSKFPVLSVNYSSTTFKQGTTTPTPQKTTGISVNNDVLAGINEISNSIPSLNIYPNPTTNQFNINFKNESAEEISVLVLNNLGQVVKTAEIANTKGEVNTSVNVNGLSPGVYFVKTNVGSKSTIKKLIIE